MQLFYIDINVSTHIVLKRKKKTLPPWFLIKWKNVLQKRLNKSTFTAVSFAFNTSIIFSDVNATDDLPQQEWSFEDSWPI